MYGWVLKCIESLVLNKYGIEKWKEILAAASCPIRLGDFIKDVHYPDDLVHSIIMAATKCLEQSQTQFIEGVGEIFMSFFREHGYTSTLKSLGTNFSEFLKNINEPHRLLRSRFPESYLPELWCTNFEQHQDGSQSCILHYYSQRGYLFAPLVVGLMKSLGVSEWQVLVEMKELQQAIEEEYIHTVWKVVYRDLPSSAAIGEQSRTRPPSLGPSDPTNNRILRCPFTQQRLDVSPVQNQGMRKKAPVEIGLSYQRLVTIFPYHLIVDMNMEILQYGNKIQEFLRLDTSREIYRMEEIFAFLSPPGLKWSWDTILAVADSNIELYAMRVGGNVAFRGNLVILDPQLDPGVVSPCAMILISPEIGNLKELEQFNMTLNDLPVHSCQRDLAILGKLDKDPQLTIDDLSFLLQRRASFE